MYIAKIRIQNFRCFQDIEIEFNEGLNVIIGENNSGKTTIMKAIQYIFNNSHINNPTVDDFNKSIPIEFEPPFIRIVLTLRSSKKEKIEDKAIVSSWLTKLESPWEATLTYKFFLPENNLNEYQEDLEKAKRGEKDCWDVLEKHLKKYVSRIYAGNEDSKNRAEPEYIKKFHCEYLDALRDVESKMFMGKNAMLKQVLTHFIDSDIKQKKEEEKALLLGKREKEFNKGADIVVSNMIKRVQTSNIFELAEKTGATVGGKPIFGGNLAKEDVISVLKLMIKKKTGIEIPIINNGMGYNNLVYISLILSNFKMLMSSDLGENAKVFPMLLIEEPEAHLHPALQYNFLKFLKEEIDNQQISRQIFITTHSTHITAAVGLDPIICMNYNESGEIVPSYPGRVFSKTDKEDIKSKKYVERYLDATKSEMLFAKSVIMGEGIAEQLIFPILTEYDNKSFEKSHVAMVRVDALTFKHFIKMFGAGIKKENKKFALKRRVACVIDTDPCRREIDTDKSKKKRRWVKCYPFQLEFETDKYEFKPISDAALNLKKVTEKTNNVRVFYNTSGKGKTLEYDLAFENSDSAILFNKEVKIKKPGDIAGDIEGLAQSNWGKKEKQKALKAVSFLLHAEKGKGEVAFDLADKLKDNIQKLDNDKTKEKFIVPSHIRDAFTWVCGAESEDKLK